MDNPGLLQLWGYRVAEYRSWEKLRPWPVYLLAACIPVSLAATNVAKLLAFLMCLVVTANAVLRHSPLPQLGRLWSAPVILAMLAALALSLAWTTAPTPEALGDVIKYSKLLLIPAIVVLLRTPREAFLALATYLAVQGFVIFTSWLLYLQVPVFWVPAGHRNSIATVYSSYLDQSIMTAAFAAICWHLRQHFPVRSGVWIGMALALAAIVNVLFMLPGRSGHLAAIAVLSLAFLWALPHRWRVAGLLAPFLFVALAMAISPQFNERLTLAVQETSSFQKDIHPTTSSGMRLSFWHRSIQAIAERPFTGYGVGSWNQQYRRLENNQPSPETAKVRNPHQEYLLWGVQLGVGGALLLVGFMVALMRDAQRFSTPARRATQSVVLVLAVACLFNSSLFDALIGEFFCIVFGLLLAYGLQRQPAAPAP